jgi:predicted RND superfamily exporter protein
VSDAVSHLATSPFRGIVDRHLIRTAEGYHYLIYLNYRGAEFPQQEFLAKAKQVDPELRSTGVDLVSRQLGDSVKRSFRWGATVGAILVLFLLLSHFSSPAGIFYSLFPLFAGVVGMLGIMGLTGMKLNFMNVMVIVTIIGMGSDYGLHVAHRTRNCGEEEYPGRFVQSGRAVLLSALTTIMGFGSLALTDYGALSSIGWATSIGVAMTALFVAVLPACMFYIRFPREKEL